MLNHSKPLRQRHGLSTAGFRFIVPEKCVDHLDMTDMLARRIVEAVKAFHATAPDHVLRLSPQRLFRAG